MKQKFFLLYCIASAMFFCSGCTFTGEEMGRGSTMHAEFLVAVADEDHYILKYITGDIPDSLVSSAEAGPCNAQLPEDFSCQTGDYIEADYYFPDVPSNVIPYLDIENATLLSKATDETLQEALDFQDRHLLTEEACKRRDQAILQETPVSIPADADWIEIAFYGSSEAQNYKFTDPDAISYVQGLLLTDSWQNSLNGFAGPPSEYIYAEKDDNRYIVGVYDYNGNLGFQVDLIKGEEETFTRYYLAEDMGYTDFIRSLEEICL